jgi:outer membrane protein TolC
MSGISPAPEYLRPETITTPPSQELLADLEAWALANNPTLRRMQQEAAAEWDRTGYVSQLPDPTVSSMFFAPPMHFEPDRQLADIQVMQMIPWLSRLKAEAQQAHLEALAAETTYQAERLRVIGDIRATWFKLYVLGKQVETTEADKAQLQSLITTANARIRTGAAQPGDVLMATLELSSLQEQLLGYRQQIVATTAELNRLIGRDSSSAIAPPVTLDARLPEWNHEQLMQTAMRAQPELVAARLRAAAARWGVEVARLKRRPDLTFGIGWMPMDAPGAMMPGAGKDSLSLGVTASIPIWHNKYNAMISEASRQHHAACASEDEVALRLDALLRDLWEQAVVSQQTVELYETSILPQARQTFEADQQSLVNNTVTFDRVIRDYRTLLNLELGYHRALGQLATTLARIRQAVGVDFSQSPQWPQG